MSCKNDENPLAPVAVVLLSVVLFVSLIFNYCQSLISAKKDIDIREFKKQAIELGFAKYETDSSQQTTFVWNKKDSLPPTNK